MIEQIVLALGIKGLLIVALGAALAGVGVYSKLAISARDAKIAERTAQVQRVAAERDNLLNANRQLAESVKRQGESIASYMTAAQLQKGRADDAAKRLASVQDEYQAYIRHLDQSIGQGDRGNAIKETYDDSIVNWNRHNLDNGKK